jgi:hypothetical protein
MIYPQNSTASSSDFHRRSQKVVGCLPIVGGGEEKGKENPGWAQGCEVSRRAFLYGYPKEPVFPILIRAPTEAGAELRLTRRTSTVIVICHSRRSRSRSDKEGHSNHSNSKKYYTHTKRKSKSIWIPGPSSSVARNIRHRNCYVML